MIIAFILMIKEKITILKKLGIGFTLLLLPLTSVLIDYIVFGKDFKLIMYVSLVILYILVEVFLDLVLKIDFRSKLGPHILYIILEYAACFSIVFGVITLDSTIGWIISGFFWTMLALLVYYIIIKKKRKQEIDESQSG